MAYCPHCNNEYDEENDSQPCCECGHPFVCGCEEPDISMDDSIYKETLQEFKNSLRNNIFENLKDNMIFYSYKTEDINKSLDRVNEAINNNSRDHKAFMERSILYYSLEDFENAIFDSAKAIQILEEIISNQKSETISNESKDKLKNLLYFLIKNVGLMYYKAHDYSIAVYYFNKANKINPDEGTNYFYRGDAYLFLNEFEKAISDWGRYLNLETGNTYRVESKSRINRLNKILRNNRSSIFIDDRDGNEYRTIEICNQLWLADNLDYNLEGSTAFDISTVFLKRFGRYYNYEQALEACPPGWKIPSRDDFVQLVNSLGGSDLAGRKLLEGELSGFSALLNGFRGGNRYSYSDPDNNINNKDLYSHDNVHQRNNILGLDDIACFWTNEIDEIGQPYYFLISDNEGLFRLRKLKRSLPQELYLFELSMEKQKIINIGFEISNKLQGMNVRCLKS